MPQVYLGVGHGKTPEGTWDQGAQAPGRNEYEMNWNIVFVIAAALDRCGVSFFNEEAAGKGHDPDFIGSAIKANALNVQLAIEVHHNASASHAGFGCEMLVHPNTSESNRRVGRGAGIEQQRPVVAEDQVEERGLIVDRLALPQDDRVLVIAVDLDRRVADLLPGGCAVDPADGQGARGGRPGREVDDAVSHAPSPGSGSGRGVAAMKYRT
jgi:N-acetylmuramoyl-L-alanine amidase